MTAVQFGPMAEEHRRVVAATTANARALADNLINQGYVVAEAQPAYWVLRRARRRGDQIVTIAIQTPATPAAWAPPTGPPA